MALYNFHRVLIAAAILFFLGFAVYAFRQYSQGKEAINLVMALSSLVATIGAIAYLIYFNIRLRGLRARGEAR